MILKNIIESLIFAAAKGVTKATLKEAFGGEYSLKEIDNALEELSKQYSGDSGIVLIEYNSTYQFRTNEKYGDKLAELLMPIKERQLSQTVLQTLAIIAYSQPITRPEIETIRNGISCDYAISVLLKSELIVVKGRRDTPGHPAMYGTTDKFLKHFGLKTLADLPSYEEMMRNDRLKTGLNKVGGSIYAIKDQALYSEEDDSEYIEEKEREAHEFLETEENKSEADFINDEVEKSEAYACTLDLQSDGENPDAPQE